MRIETPELMPTLTECKAYAKTIGLNADAAIEFSKTDEHYVEIETAEGYCLACWFQSGKVYGEY